MSATMTRPTHCIGCRRKFRPHRTEEALFPGTVMHAGRGLCTTCHKQRATSERETLAPEELARQHQLEVQRMAQLIIERARFEADRARRGIPEHGRRTIRVALTHRSIPVLQEAA